MPRVRCESCENVFTSDDNTCAEGFPLRFWCPPCCQSLHCTCVHCGHHYRDTRDIGEHLCGESSNCDACAHCGDDAHCCGDEESESDDDSDSYPDESGSGRARDYHCEPGKPWRADNRSQRLDFNSTRLVGVEWEFNHANTYRPLGLWAKDWRSGWHSDGSCGEEIVTAPIAGDHIADCLGSLAVAFRAAGATINESCGIHVHLDASDYDWHSIYRLIKVYSIIEPALYLLGGHKRAANNYCRPLGSRAGLILKAQDRKAAVHGLCYFQRPLHDPEEAREYVRSQDPGKKSGNRYMGLNLLPWLSGRRKRATVKKRSFTRQLGEIGNSLGAPRHPDTTVEIRIHSNSRDGSRVTNWAHLLVRVFDWVAKATEAEVAKLPADPFRALLTIAPESQGYILRQIKHWKRVTRLETRYRRGGSSPSRHVVYAPNARTWIIPNAA